MVMFNSCVILPEGTSPFYGDMLGMQTSMMGYNWGMMAYNLIQCKFFKLSFGLVKHSWGSHQQMISHVKWGYNEDFPAPSDYQRVSPKRHEADRPIWGTCPARCDHEDFWDFTLLLEADKSFEAWDAAPSLDFFLKMSRTSSRPPSHCGRECEKCIRQPSVLIVWLIQTHGNLSESWSCPTER